MPRHYGTRVPYGWDHTELAAHPPEVTFLPLLRPIKAEIWLNDPERMQG